MGMLTLLLSCPGTYAVLAAFVAMIVFSARAKPDPSGEPAHQPDRKPEPACAIRHALPAKVRLLMQEAARRPDFPWDLLASCVAAYNTQFSEVIKHIHRRGPDRPGAPQREQPSR
jgi:hypothetical protein